MASVHALCYKSCVADTTFGTKTRYIISPFSLICELISYTLWCFCLSIGHSLVEDLELANLMGSLGLPVSFSTSKVVSAHIMQHQVQFPCWLICCLIPLCITEQEHRQQGKEKRKKNTM